MPLTNKKAWPEGQALILLHKSSVYSQLTIGIMEQWKNGILGMKSG
jgi:hypothetical protein